MTHDVPNPHDGLKPRVDRVLSGFDGDELEGVLAERGGAAALDAAGALRAVIRRRGDQRLFGDAEGGTRWLAFVRRLVEAGVDLGQPATAPSALTLAVQAGIPTGAKAEVVRLLLAAGADPHSRAATGGPSAFEAARGPRVPPAVRKLLEAHPPYPGWAVDQLVADMQRGWRPPAGELDAWLDTVAEPDTTGHDGLAPLHAAVLAAEPDLVRAVLSRVGEPDLRTTDHGAARVSRTLFGCYLVYVPGMTALDLVDQARTEVGARLGHLAELGLDHRRDEYEACLERLATCRAALAAAGATRGGGTAPLTQPSFVASRDLHFTVCSQTAHVVVGRPFYGRWRTAEFSRMCGRIDAFGAALGRRLAVLAVGDHSASDTRPTLDAHCVVGLLLTSLEDAYEPVRLDRATLLEAQGEADALPWDDIAALVPPGRETGHGDARTDLLAQQRSAPYAVPIGPVAGVSVTYGIVVGEEDPDEPFGYGEEDDFVARYVDCPGGPGRTVPGLDFHRAQAAGFEAPAQGVYGIADVAFGHVEHGVPEPIDLSPAAHEKRRARLGALAAEAEYHVVLHFD